MTDANPQALGLMAKLVLGSAIVLIAAGVLWHGITAAVFERFWHDLLERPDGPMRFRFILQPLMAAIAAIHDFTGRKPRGWESPGLTETFETIDILAEEGIEYVADWVLDDQPCEISTKAGPVVSIPYTVETNDIAMIALQHHSADEMVRRCVDQFDRLYLEGESITRIMALSFHPYISGVPHRIKHVEAVYEHMKRHSGVLFWTGEQILDWYRQQRRG